MSGTGEQRRGLFSWLGRSARRALGGPDGQAPALRLARDWVLAQGGTVREDGAEYVVGALPDGTVVRYTSSVLRARQEPGVTLLAPGAPELESLLDGVAAAGNGLTLRLDAGPASAETLARNAFVAVTDESEDCLERAGVASPGAGCEMCCPASSQYVVLGTGKGTRDAQVVRRSEGASVEYTFHMSVTSPRGRREELVRVGVDLATGARLAPVPEVVLMRAHAAPGDATLSGGSKGTFEQAETLLQPAFQAAARLARAQGLPEYQRRQKEIETRAFHLIAETPDTGAEILAIRQRELQRLAETHAVELDVRLVGCAILLAPRADVRVRLVGGGEATVEVDLTRGEVDAPRCGACSASWQVGARCVEGHVTCLRCQEKCAHCGARRCSQCASAAYALCPTCAGPACASCLRAIARGRHRLSAPTAHSEHPRPVQKASLNGESPVDDRGRTEDLQVTDLDAMTSATWRACMAWMLEGYGYAVEREVPSNDAEGILLCRHTHAGQINLPWTDEAPADRVAAVGYRPAGRLTLDDGMVARAAAQVPDVAGARRLLITTGRVDAGSQGKRTPGLVVVDRDRLIQLLVDLATSFSRDAEKVEREMDGRAQAAGAVRAALMAGLDGAAALAGRGSLPQPQQTRRAARTRRAENLHEGAQIARRALIALETLVDEWEAVFPTTPTRDGNQEITATVTEIEDMHERAQHLLEALHQGCGQLGGTLPDAVRTYTDWRQAVVEELQQHCAALSLRCEAVEPAAWRVFNAVRDRAAAERGVEAAAASRRASARARKLWDEEEARAGATPLPARQSRG